MIHSSTYKSNDTIFDDGLGSATILILEILNHHVIHSHKIQVRPQASRGQRRTKTFTFLSSFCTQLTVHRTPKSNSSKKGRLSILQCLTFQAEFYALDGRMLCSICPYDFLQVVFQHLNRYFSRCDSFASVLLPLFLFV